MLLASPEVEAMVALDHVISVLNVQGSDLGHVIQEICYCTSLEVVELAHRAWKKVCYCIPILNSVGLSVFARKFSEMRRSNHGCTN